MLINELNVSKPMVKFDVGGNAQSGIHFFKIAQKQFKNSS